MEEHELPDIGDRRASEIDEEGRNLTQRRIDEEGADERPVDASWTDDADPFEDDVG
jgi:hypothetical protein